MRQLFNVNNYKARWLFLFLIAMYLIISYILNTSIVSDQIIVQSYTLMPDYQLPSLIAALKKSQSFSYFLLPFLILIKVVVLTLIIFIAIIFLEIDISFNPILKVTLLSEFVFVIAALVKVIGLMYFHDINTLEDLAVYTPLSLYSILGDTFGKYFVYPLKVINVFELLYIAILSYALSIVLDIDYFKSVRAILLTYGVALLLWIVLLMFLQYAYM
jgi:hypothetical protein